MAQAPAASTTASASAAPARIEDQMLAQVDRIWGTPQDNAVATLPERPREVERPEIVPEPEPLEPVTEETPVVEEPAPVDDDPEFEIPVDGVPQKARLSDLKKDFSARKHITQTMQQQAAERDRLAALDAQVAADRKAYVERLELLEQMRIAQMPPEPDWAALKAADPAKYAAERVDWDLAEKKLYTFRAEREREMQKEAARQQNLMAERMVVERSKLLDAVPEWKDPAAMSSGQATLTAYLTGPAGYRPDEVQSVADHRAIVLAEKARKWDELQAAKPALTRGASTAPAVVRPGAQQVPRKPLSAEQEAKRRLAKTGDPRDAEAALLAMLERGALGGT